MPLDVSSLPSAKDVQDRVNERYDRLFLKDPDGTRVPFVCTICDEFLISQHDVCVLKPSSLEAMTKTFSWESLPTTERIPDLEDVYTFKGSLSAIDDPSWVRGLALSPRGRLFKKNKSRGKAGFTCCSKCKSNVEKLTLPMNAIINKNYVGGAPTCLTDLTEVERALISPVKHHGYCFSYAGGKQKLMKGTLVFMRVKERRVAQAAAQLEEMGLSKHILVLLSGNMTAYQKQKAKDKACIRTDKVIAAIKWLCAHHRSWQHVDYDEMVEALRKVKPVVLDQSNTVESENANVEEQELFSCYYPEGADTPTDGGFDESGAFKKYVEEMHEKQFDLEFKVNLQKEFVKGDDNDQLISACLLQFPFGVGGMDEDRLKADGSTTDSADLESFLGHLSRVADPTFQTPLFQLISYTLVSKERLLKTSRLQLKGETHAKSLAEGINSQDLAKAIRGRRAGNRNSGTTASKNLLNAVDACSRALPHTNEAAKKGRAMGESMQHYYGNGSVFLTATFDDEHNLLIQILTGKCIDTDEDLSSLSDEEMFKRSEAREALRLTFPGATAIHFEMLLEILAEEVIGWDIRKNQPTDKPGFFGDVYAFTMAIEEQGRKSLHAHMTLWIRLYKQLERDVFFAAETSRKKATGTLVKYHEHIASTTLMVGTERELQKAFDHSGCSETRLTKRKLPQVVTDQCLRDLRHKQGYKYLEGVFASCPEPNCGKTWTYETMVCDYMNNGEMYCLPCDGANAGSVFDYTQGEVSKSIPKDRIRAEVIQFQKGDRTMDEKLQCCVCALYQTHVSCHTKGCFKCNQKKRHTCNPNCTCRYRLPDLARLKALLQIDHASASWFEWNGTEGEQPICQMLPKRLPYDLFQNTSCPAISLSKLACNSNVSLILAGPIAQYQFKYQLKGTQKDDTADYEKVHLSIKNVTGRVHETDRSEALRLICRAAFAHNKTNVISAPMASYLVRNKERFYFSHTTQYCPLADVMKLHDKKDVSGQLLFASDGTSFFENQALHYLCRPTDLEDVNLKEFTEAYYTLRVTGGKASQHKNKKKKQDNPIKPFEHDTGFFQHPSATFDDKGNFKGCQQGVKERLETVLCKISQWQFPDTGTFKKSILNCEEHEMNNQMEKYSQLVLTLLLPHRSVKDLTVPNTTAFPYTKRLQDIYKQDTSRKRKGYERKNKVQVFTSENVEFLQNIQNSAYNDLRYKIKLDALESCTVPFIPDEFDSNEDQEDEEDEIDLEYETLLDQLDIDETPLPNDDDPTYLPQALAGLTLKKHRNKGTDKCGYISDLKTPNLRETCDTSIPFIQTVPNRDSNQFTADSRDFSEKVRKTYSIKRVVTLFMKRTCQRVRKNVFDGVDINVSDANGSIESIREWGGAVFSKDIKQRRAFEAIIAAFILSFYEGDPEENVAAGTSNADRVKYRQMQKALLKLRGSDNSSQLIALLHGPGGSGKSTVINMVKAYAQAFCESIGHEYTSRTVVVTAMSGVAATLLGGETTHSVLGLSKKTSKFTNEECDDFVDCRLIIIDEISFASAKNFEKMQRHLSLLLRKRYHIYGGTNVVFAGDYSQLEPVGQKTIYSGDDCAEFHHRVNCFIELEGTWRFRDDPVWGERMRRFREGCPTLDDIDTINDQCLIEFKPPPRNIQVATHRNRDRDAINTSIFDEFCKEHAPTNGDVLESAAVIFMDELEMQTSKKTYEPLKSNTVKKFFYENCGEDNCKMGENARGRVDPMLKLYQGCPMMLTKNTDVPNGEANGSRIRIEGVSIKPGEQPFELELECGTKVIGLFASQVKHITVKHESPDITPQVFDVCPDDWTFSSKMRIGHDEMTAGMKGHQFPIISNACTTGHKLQGCTVLSLLVNNWHYGQNWTYVVLSRVKTMDGLYIRQPLTRDLSKYKMDPKMIQMMTKFRQHKALPTISDDDYATMIRETTAH